LERLEIIEALKDLPIAIEAETRGLSETALRYRPTESEWSVKEIAGHLLDYAGLYQKRFYMIWSLNDPVLPGLDASGEVESVREHNYQDASLAEIIAGIRAVRGHTIDLLVHAVDWSRLGQQPGIGRRSLKQFAEGAISHEANHLAQIRQVKAQQTARTTT
jgi:hypothetical protein